MTLKADGVTIPTTGWNVSDGGILYDTVKANGSIIWERVPDVPASISYASSATEGDTKTISWASASRADNYTLEYKINSGSWNNVGTFTGTSTNFTLNTVATYYFRVKANNNGGSSGYRTGSGCVVASAIVQSGRTVTEGQYSSNGGYYGWYGFVKNPSTYGFNTTTAGALSGG